MTGVAPNPNESRVDWLNSLSDSFDAFDLPAADTLAPAASPSAQPTATDRDTLEKPSLEVAVKRMGAASFETPWDLKGEQETLRLSRKELPDYSTMLTRAVQSAQLSSRFMPNMSERFAALSVLSLLPSATAFDIQRETGMPTPMLWITLDGARMLSRTPGAFRTVMAGAVETLKNLPDPKLNEVEIKVVESTANGSLFAVSANRYRHPGFIVRTQLEILQPLTADGPIVSKNGNRQLTGALADIMEATTGESLSAIALAAKKACGAAFVAAKQGIAGPVYFKDMIAPPAIAEILATSPSSIIATFTEFEMRPNQSLGESTWVDPGDPFLEMALESGWSAIAEKTWVCTPELVAPLRSYAAENDSTLTVRAFL